MITSSSSTVHTGSFNQSLAQGIGTAISAALQPFMCQVTGLLMGSSSIASSQPSLAADSSISFPSSAPDPLQQQHQQPIMPAISSSVLERIRRGEFINFDLLLPNNVPSETSIAFSLSLENSDSSTSPRQ